MTEDQEALLLDKLEVWKRQAVQGPTDFRDYNARAVDALDALFRRKHELEGEVSTLRLQQQTDRQTIASLSATPEGLREKVARAIKAAPVADMGVTYHAEDAYQPARFEAYGAAAELAFLLFKERNAILAALQPQAQPAALSPETDQ